MFLGACLLKNLAWIQYWLSMKIFARLVNEVRARFHLLTSFRQGNRSINKLYNAVQAQVSFAKYPQETANILHHDIFWFSLKDEEFASKTINDSSIDLEKFLASKVRQIAKKMESSKATHHIKQIANDPQATQINLMRHQHTTSYKVSTRGNTLSSDDYSVTSGIQVNTNNKCHPTRGSLILNKPIQEKDSCSKCGDSKHIEGFMCPTKKFQCKACNKYGHFTSLYCKKSVSFKSEYSKHISYKVRQCTCNNTLYVASQKI